MPLHAAACTLHYLVFYILLYLTPYYLLLYRRIILFYILLRISSFHKGEHRVETGLRPGLRYFACELCVSRVNCRSLSWCNQSREIEITRCQCATPHNVLPLRTITPLVLSSGCAEEVTGNGQSVAILTTSKCYPS